MHQRLSLDGTWEFLHTQLDRVTDISHLRDIEVPGPWQAQFVDLRTRAGIGIYRRTFLIEPKWRSGKVFLRFGAVFHNTKVWLNGQFVGQNEGGFLPFSFDVSEFLVEGENEIKVRAESPTDNPINFPDAPFAEIQFGKQSWYGPLSGIWQSVYLECREADHIERVRVAADLSSGEVGIKVFLAGPLRVHSEIRLRLFGPDGGEVATARKKVAASSEECAQQVTVRQPAAWSPDHPNLYRAEIAVWRQGKVIDQTERSFGFRTIETRAGKFFLNGEPLFLRAALDQDYYPDLICTMPSMEFVEDQFRKAKELGLNCLRCHIKAPDPRYYDAADRIGLLIWTELPNGGISTERSRARKERLLKGIIDRDSHHPSIIIWTIINENWGTDLVHDPEHRAWLKRTYHWLKQYDPSRLVVDNSPLAPSFHVETDIADYHFYSAFPDGRQNWDLFVQKLSGRGSFLFSEDGDAVITGQEPVICSEFGNWGLPNPASIRDANGREPWWFETGHDWGEGIMYPHGVENRFMDWSLDRVFGSLEGLVEAAQWQQFRALKYEIETMRAAGNLPGYCITEFTDAHWESNGLLDMCRNPRVFHDVFRTINADTVIVPRWTDLACREGDTLVVSPMIAHGAGRAITDAVLEVGPRGPSLPVGPVEPGTTIALDPLELSFGQSGVARLEHVDFSLKLPDGRLAATNRLTIAVFPQSPPPPEDLWIWCADDEIAERFDALGYRIAAELDKATLAVTRTLEEGIPGYVRSGGRLLLLPDSEFGLNPLFPHWQNVVVRERDGTQWRGDWASSFAWLLREGPFARLPGGPLLDETVERIIPSHVIVNCNLLDFQARVHAGMVVGWIHKPVALVVERPYGTGRFVVSTLRVFQDEPRSDPTATALLSALVELSTT